MERFIKKILVPVDGSDASRRAIEMALAMARTAKAQVTILEVIEDFGPLPGHYEEPPPGRDRVEWVSEQRFEKIHEPLDNTDVKWDRRVVRGYPADAICDLAASESYDLIVIGNKGHGAVARFLLGSVSDRVVHHAPCSVTVVR